MLDNSALEQVSEFLRPFHFHIPVYQRLYEAILKLAARGQLAGPITLKNYFEKDGDLDHVGGTEYLADLLTSSSRSSTPSITAAQSMICLCAAS
jgi:replicative DNA helicase